MKNWQHIILILAIVLLQVTIIPDLKFFYSLPNLPFIFLLICLIRNNDYSAIWWVAYGGFLMDIFSNQFFGYFSLEFLLVFILYRAAIRPLISEPQIPIIFIVFTAFHFIIFVFEALLNSINPFSSLANIIIYQSIFAVLVYLLSSKLSKKHTISLKI